MGLNLSPEEGHSHGIVWVGAEVDSVNGDFGPGFLGLHSSGGVVDFVESGLQEDGGGRAVLSGCEMVLFILERLFSRLGVFLVVVPLAPSFDNWRMSSYEGCCSVDSVRGELSLVVVIVRGVAGQLQSRGCIPR